MCALREGEQEGEGEQDGGRERGREQTGLGLLTGQAEEQNALLTASLQLNTQFTPQETNDELPGKTKLN